jgi:hypothetical protein
LNRIQRQTITRLYTIGGHGRQPYRQRASSVRDIVRSWHENRLLRDRFLANPTNTGNTLILAGTDSQATEAGGDFLTSEEDLERLQALFDQKTLPHFQLLLRISRSNGTPLGSEIISYRIIKNSDGLH